MTGTVIRFPGVTTVPRQLRDRRRHHPVLNRIVAKAERAFWASLDDGQFLEQIMDSFLRVTRPETSGVRDDGRANRRYTR